MSKIGFVIFLLLCARSSSQVQAQSAYQQEDSEETCFDGPFDNVGVEGCLGECEDYDTLEQAQTICLTTPGCDGVTLAAYGDDDAITAGIGLYELRQGPGLLKANGDKSWIKQAWCKDANEASINPGLHRHLNNDYLDSDQHNDEYESEEDSWDYNMEKVGEAYTSVFFNMLYVAGFLALAAAGIGIAYCSGDASTIAIVDSLTEKIRVFILKRGPQSANNSSYESL
jgi:hypothetical protein